MEILPPIRLPNAGSMERDAASYKRRKDPAKLEQFQRSQLHPGASGIWRLSTYPSWLEAYDGPFLQDFVQSLLKGGSDGLENRLYKEMLQNLVVLAQKGHDST